MTLISTKQWMGVIWVINEHTWKHFDEILVLHCKYYVSSCWWIPLSRCTRTIFQIQIPFPFFWSCRKEIIRISFWKKIFENFACLQLIQHQHPLKHLKGIRGILSKSHIKLNLKWIFWKLRMDFLLKPSSMAFYFSFLERNLKVIMWKFREFWGIPM